MGNWPALTPVALDQMFWSSQSCQLARKAGQHWPTDKDPEKRGNLFLSSVSLDKKVDIGSWAHLHWFELHL